FALPDTFFTAAILFAVAVVWRRDIASFIAAILLLAGRAVTALLLQGPQWDRIRALFDPYGVNAFVVVTKYWTVADKNILSLSFNGLLLWNRLLWLAVGCAAFALAYSRFSFAEKRTKTKALEPDAQPVILPAAAPPPQPHVPDSFPRNGQEHSFSRSGHDRQYALHSGSVPGSYACPGKSNSFNISRNLLGD